MTRTYLPSELVQAARGELAPPACDDTLGIRIHHCEGGRVVGEWKAEDRFCNGHGVIMGGFVTAAMDVLMAYAVASCVEDNQSFASIDLHTTYHRPGFPGNHQVTATVERKGRTILYLTAQLVQNGKLIASAVSSVFVREKDTSS